MSLKIPPFLVLTLISLSLFVPTYSQLLSATYLNATLPLPNACPVPFYDGFDSIYLFGGCRSNTYHNLLKFSISSETIQEIGQLPGVGLLGTVQSGSSGHIFYLGGGLGGDEVYLLDPSTNVSTTVATLTSNIRYGLSIKYSVTTDIVYILGGGGQSRDLLSINFTSLEYSTLSSNLSFAVGGGSSFTFGRKAFIFDNTDSEQNRQALELDLESLTMTPVGPESLPIFNWYPASVTDGRFGYILGGYRSNSDNLTGGIIQFDPITYENTFIPVGNLPVGDFTFAPASVFVGSLNRIYYFGGESYNSATDSYITHDEILYVDLSPLSPTPSTSTTTREPIHETNLNFEVLCNNRANGIYPHLTDCSLFLGCQDEEMTIFKCPSPLLFDQLRLICTFPNEVECPTSTV